MCFCLIYFNLGNVSSCIDMYLGIFVNRIEVEVSLPPMDKWFQSGMKSNANKHFGDSRFNASYCR